jgi:hypothetical protein
MLKNLTCSLQSSFLAYEKDIETILKKLFVEPYNNKNARIKAQQSVQIKDHREDLKRLLVINEKDCLDNRDSKIYNDTILKVDLAYLRQNGYIKLEPKFNFSEHAEIKSYIIISMDNFVPNETNPQFRDCTVSFDIICHTDCWDIGNYRLRPLKIAGYIDGILNNAKLSGIGEFHFLGCNELILNEDFSGYTLSYTAIHGSDDSIASEE